MLEIECIRKYKNEIGNRKEKMNKYIDYIDYS